jgi:hypothetical protein
MAFATQSGGTHLLNPPEEGGLNSLPVWQEQFARGLAQLTTNLSNREVPDSIYRHQIHTCPDRRLQIKLGATPPYCDPIAKPPIQISINTILEPNQVVK